MYNKDIVVEIIVQDIRFNQYFAALIIIMIMWAVHCHRLEPLTLLPAQWHLFLSGQGGQIFFGGVFDKRAGMLFAARRNEDGNVHRRVATVKYVVINLYPSGLYVRFHRARLSKTMTKNMRVGFFKNKKIKAQKKTAPNGAACLPTRQKYLTAVSAVSSFLMEIFPFCSARCSRLTLSTNASRWIHENLIISSKLLITKGYCELFIEKRFELRSEVCDNRETQQT